METFESTEMVPGRTAQRVCPHCFCQMPGGSRNCIFEGTGVCEKAISALIMSLFAHLQKIVSKANTVYLLSFSVPPRKEAQLDFLYQLVCLSAFFRSGGSVLPWRPMLVFGGDTNKKKWIQTPASWARLLASILLCKDEAAVSESSSDFCCHELRQTWSAMNDRSCNSSQQAL